MNFCKTIGHSIHVQPSHLLACSLLAVLASVVQVQDPVAPVGTPSAALTATDESNMQPTVEALIGNGCFALQSEIPGNRKSDSAIQER